MLMDVGQKREVGQMSLTEAGQDGKASPGRAGRRRPERLRMIVDVVNANGTVDVEHLAQTVGVSLATVRRDLALLSEQGMVLRNHGGAARTDRGYELPLHYRAGSNADEKRRIALAAAKMVSDGCVVGITGGTTAMEVARALVDRLDLIVVTNALNVASELAMHRNIRVSVTGGTVRPISFELSGPIAEQTIRNYNLDIAFVGADGIDRLAGVTTHNESEALTNAALASRARRVVVVADHTKLGQVRFARICTIDKVHTLITGNESSREELDGFCSEGVEVILTGRGSRCTPLG